MEYIPTFTMIYHKNQPNVGEYTIHGSYGLYIPKWLCFGEFVLLDSLNFNDSNVGSDDFCEHPGSLDPLGGQILGDVLGHFFHGPLALPPSKLPQKYSGFFIALGILAHLT